MVRLLLHRGADVNAEDRHAGSALLDACQEGNLEVVKLLLVNGADCARDGSKALLLAARGDHLDVVKALRDRGVKLTLPVAATINDLDGARAHIEAEASAKDMSEALMLAAERGHIEIVRLLLKKGMDVDAKDEYRRTA